MNIKSRLDRIEKKFGAEKNFDVAENLGKLDMEIISEIYANDDADDWEAEDFDGYPEVQVFIKRGYTLDEVFRMMLGQKILK